MGKVSHIIHIHALQVQIVQAEGESAEAPAVAAQGARGIACYIRM